ncbi:MAG: tyrosine--tRNA ligase [Christensenellales bacterium]
MFNKQDTLKFLLKGAENPDVEALTQKIDEVFADGRVLNIKFGLDPSAPDIHLGHAVALRKLKQLQDLGHNVSIIIGDFTGMIGDPSGRSKTRNQLSREQVRANAQTYVDQIFKILNKDKTTVLYNSDWYAKMTFPQIIDLCSKATVARILERDDFSKRYKSGTPIAVHEFFYPLMQAYDSVVCKSDIELGGTDQTFNILLGRNIQKDYDVKQQVPLFVPLLQGTDGIEKMSKSLNNYVGINEEPKVMYEKVMKIPDELIIRYYDLTTDLHPDDIAKIQQRLKNGENPRNIKMELAKEIVRLYHGSDLAQQAEDYFVATYQKNVFSDQTPVIKLAPEHFTPDGNLYVVELLFSTGKYKSKGEIRRLIQGGAVKLNGEKLFEPETTLPQTDAIMLQVGKGTLFKVEK